MAVTIHAEDGSERIVEGWRSPDGSGIVHWRPGLGDDYRYQVGGMDGDDIIAVGLAKSMSAAVAKVLQHTK